MDPIIPRCQLLDPSLGPLVPVLRTIGARGRTRAAVKYDAEPIILLDFLCFSSAEANFANGALGRDADGAHRTVGFRRERPDTEGPDRPARVAFTPERPADSVRSSLIRGAAVTPRLSRVA